MKGVTRATLLERGVERAEEFCQVNKLTMPDVKRWEREKWRFDACAYYRPTYIAICLDKCAWPGYAGRAWSWPGYVIDRTPYGVVAHELGHHVDMVCSQHKRSYFGEFSQTIKKAACEAPITSYAPNDAEWFAEAFRLFVTNPDLLRRIRPRTHSLLVDRFKPVGKGVWDKELEGAPERTLLQAQKKMVGNGLF